MNFKQFYSGLLYDVLYTDLGYRNDFVLSNNIKKAWNFDTPLFGKLFTCKGITSMSVKNEDKKRLEMLSNIPYDSIMIYDTEHCQEVAHFGDITATIAQKAGCQGVILDGNTRDIETIEKIGFPIFCRKLSPIDSYGTWHIVDYNCEIGISGYNGDVKVYPDDYVFADATGILIIPPMLINSVYELATKRLIKENELRKAILEQRKPNLIKLYKEKDIH